MKDVIIKRGDLYLSNRYQWQRVPDLFPACHVPVILSVMRYPVMVAEVGAGALIDLDSLGFVEIGY